MCGINKAEYCIEPEMKFEMNAWWSFDDGIIIQYSTVLLFLLCWTKDIAVQCGVVRWDVGARDRDRGAVKWLSSDRADVSNLSCYITCSRRICDLLPLSWSADRLSTLSITTGGGTRTSPLIVTLLYGPDQVQPMEMECDLMEKLKHEGVGEEKSAVEGRKSSLNQSTSDHKLVQVGLGVRRCWDHTRDHTCSVGGVQTKQEIICAQRQ